MSVLRKPYELSIWGDTWNSGAGRFDEEKLVVIGSNTMTSQSRALLPKLVENVNGTHTLSFMIYYQYKDNITGEDIENPYAPYLTNERKLKLNYDGKWYDFIIKSVKEDSSKHSYEISATDQYINELSKNGFNLTLDAELNNNVGSVQTLAQKTLEATDWHVPDVMIGGSEFVPDKVKEALVEITTPVEFQATLINDSSEGEEPDISSIRDIPANATIYVFYSCLVGKTNYFQFIYSVDPLDKDDERIITNTSCQYYVNTTAADAIIRYSDTQTEGIYLPQVQVNTIWHSMTFNQFSFEYRGARYVFSPNTEYNTKLGRYVSIYTPKNPESSQYEAYYGYATTEFKAPNLIKNWVTNPSAFRSTSGWHAGTTAESLESDTCGTINNIAVRNTDANQTLLQDLESGEFNDWISLPDHHYIPKLVYTAPTSLPNSGILVNTGFYDNRIAIKTIINGQEFICRVKGSNLGGKSISLRYGEVNNESYSFLGYLTDESTILPVNPDADGYYVAKLTVQENDFTENTFKKQSPERVYIVLDGSTNIQIEDFQIFEKVGTDNDYMLPEDQLVEAQAITTYYLYPKSVIDLLDTWGGDIKDVNPYYVSTIDPSCDYNLPLSCEKRRAITIKESNYFNVIQTLCETFECWADFIITHDNDGTITSKQIIFKNYVGANNWAGFRYGVNLKSVSRTDDSKAIVSKLIVKQNSNEFGPNGFCTIARAPSNETGETCIYNIDYYINQGLLSVSDWNNYVYGTTGYFTQLRTLNNLLRAKNEIAIKQAIVLAQAKADLTTAEAGYSAAVDQYEEACDAFKKLCGYAYNDSNWTTDVRARALVTDEKNIKYLTRCGECYQARYEFDKKRAAADNRYQNLQQEYANLYKYSTHKEDPDPWDGIEELNHQKEILHKAFYEKFYRYIQEGTWNSEEYYDDEKYYLDALSTLYTSSVPKVSYNISVLELSQLQGYEDFTFAVGDRTYVEDPEFFGYDDNGAPIRETVVLSEITYNLDEPDKNSIKVQNFKTQFQDLFKKITATVQSVQFSTGAYDKAAQLADANDTQKSAYLQGALNDASTILQNLAEQTVRLDADGLTITDGAEPNRKLRAVSGGILLTEDGGNTWDVGITASGVSAKILTTGTLNTGVVNIMYGDEPTFRWDAFGITAYDFANNNPMLPILDTGVRFDRLGVYGFTGAPGDWHPNNVVTWQTSSDTHQPPRAVAGIREHSTFEVTKEGLYLDIGKGRSTYGHGRTRTVTTDNNVTTVDYTYNAIAQVIHNTIASLGKVEDVVYNKWDNGNPYYTTTEQNTVNPFVKVMSVGYKVPNTNQESENFALYDDGTVRARKILVSEGIGYDDGSGLVKIAYGPNSVLPADGTTWSGLDDTTGSWHKTRQSNDNYIATTYDNGAHWFGPTHITDKEIVSTTQEYLIANSGITPPDNDSNWSTTMPSTAGQFGKVLWVKIIAQRADGTSFVLQKLPLPIPEEISDFNVSADHNVIIVDKQQNLNATTVVCTATSGWDSYMWNVPAGVTYTSATNTLTLSLDYATVAAHQSITITCTGSKNGYTSAVDNVTIATVFDGTDGWTIINTNPTFTYTADFTGHAKTTTPENPQAETTTIEVYHGGTKIGNYDAGHSDATKYYFKVASITDTNYLTFSRVNDTFSCTISGSIANGNPSVADNSIELNIAIYKGNTIQSELAKNTKLSWVFAYDGAPGPAGASGTSPYSLELTNDSIQVGADYDGSGATFGGQVIGIQVSQGTTLQSDWDITAAQCYYVDGTLITPQPAIISSVTDTQTEVTLISGATWPTAVTTDSFILRITASNGALTLIKDATIKRLRNGQPGTWYRLQCDITTLPRLTKNPATFGITTFKVASYKYVGNIKSSVNDKYIAYTINNGITWTRVNEAGSKTFSTSSTGGIALNLSDSTTSIGFALVEADGVVNYSLDPAKTLDGPEFISIVDNGSSPYRINLFNDTATVEIGSAATSSTTTPLTESGTLTVWNGNVKESFSISQSAPTSGNDLVLTINLTNLRSNASAQTGTIQQYNYSFDQLTGFNGSAVYTLYKGLDVVATSTFTITGLRRGIPGTTYHIHFPEGDRFGCASDFIPIDGGHATGGNVLHGRCLPVEVQKITANDDGTSNITIQTSGYLIMSDGIHTYSCQITGNQYWVIFAKPESQSEASRPYSEWGSTETPSSSAVPSTWVRLDSDTGGTYEPAREITLTYKLNLADMYSVDSETIALNVAGADGAAGSSAYSLSLDEDFSTIGIGPNTSGPFNDFDTIHITPTAYEGNTIITFDTTQAWLRPASTDPLENGPCIRYTQTNCEGTYSASTGQVIVSSFTIPRGTILFTLYQDGIQVAETTYEIFGNKAGQPGEVWDIDFPEGDTIIQNNDSTYPGTIIHAHAFKRPAGEAASNESVYWKIGDTALGSTASTDLYLQVHGPAPYMWQYRYTDSGDFNPTSIRVITGSVILKAYTDSAGNNLFDQKTITIIPHGAQGPTGNNGTGTRLNDIYYLTDSSDTLNKILTGTETEDYQRQYKTMVVTATTGQYWTTTYAAPSSSYQFLIHCQQIISIASDGTETLQDWTTPELLEAWLNNSALNGTATGRERYANLYTLTNGLTSQGIYYKSGTNVNDDKLYINADMINTGALTVSDGTNTIFSASVSGQSVQIANFTVEYGKIRSGKTAYDETTNNGVYIGTDGIGLGKGKFYVTNAGYLKSTSGKIGEWEIDNNGIYNGTWTSTTQTGTTNSTNVFFMATDTTSYYRICGQNKQNWRLGINSNFGVDSTGAMYATSGQIGGFTITPGDSNSYLCSDAGSNSGRKVFYLTPNNDAKGYLMRYWYGGLDTSTSAPTSIDGDWPTNCTFAVTQKGFLYATNARITGIINATSGTIGGWTLTNGKLTAGTAGSTGFTFFGTADYGSLNIQNYPWSDWRFIIGSKFGVDKYGNVVCGKLYMISGEVGYSSAAQPDQKLVFATNSSRAYIYSRKSTLTSTSEGIYIGTDGIALGANNVFKVTSAGVITAASGKIGGWTLKSRALLDGTYSALHLYTYPDSLVPNPTGIIMEAMAYADDGNYYAVNINAEGIRVFDVTAENSSTLVKTVTWGQFFSQW